MSSIGLFLAVVGVNGVMLGVSIALERLVWPYLKFLMSIDGHLRPASIRDRRTSPVLPR